MTLDQPRIYVALGDRLGLANIAYPFDYGGGVLAALCGQTLLWYAQGSPDAPARVAARTRVTLGVLGILAVTWAVGLSRLPNSHDASHDPVQNWGELALRLTLAAWAAYALGDIAVLSGRFARRAAARPLRAGMALVSAGAVLALVRLVVEYGAISFADWRQPAHGATERHLIHDLNLGALVGFALMAGGFGLPALARRLRAAALWLVDLDHYRRLSPLWREVAPSVPTLDWPAYRIPLARRIPVLALRGRLYRRVIEVQDGYFALEPYRDPAREAEWQAEAESRGLHRQAARAFVDARSLRDAVIRYRSGESLSPSTPSRPSADHPATEDIHYLLEVAANLPRPAGPRRSTKPNPQPSPR
jgi:hypothetical protein